MNTKQSVHTKGAKTTTRKNSKLNRVASASTTGPGDQRRSTSSRQKPHTNSATKHPHLPKNDRVSENTRKHESLLTSRNKRVSNSSPSLPKNQTKTSGNSISRQSSRGGQPGQANRPSATRDSRRPSNGHGDSDKSIRYSRRMPLFPPVSSHVVPLAPPTTPRQSTSSGTSESGSRASTHVHGMKVMRQSSVERKSVAKMVKPYKVSVVSLKLPSIT